MYLGIDISKKELVCALFDEQSGQFCWRHTFENTPAGHHQLLAAVPTEADWIVEPTGRYGWDIVEQGQATGRTVRQANPFQSKHIRLGLSPRAKTDGIDSRCLARQGTMKGLFPYRLKEACVQQLDDLLRVRKSLAETQMRHSQQRRELKHGQEPLEAVCAVVREQLRAIDRDIQALVRSEPRLALARRLVAAPGIGPITAAAVTARLVHKDFACADQFVSYIGLDVAVYQSGSRKGRLGLSHKGDAELRRLLYVCAQASLRCQAEANPFAAQYQRERAKGLSTTAALCSVARKMARVCWSMYKHQTEYDPARVATQARRPKVSEAGPPDPTAVS